MYSNWLTWPLIPSVNCSLSCTVTIGRSLTTALRSACTTARVALSSASASVSTLSELSIRSTFAAFSTPIGTVIPPVTWLSANTPTTLTSTCDAGEGQAQCVAHARGEVLGGGLGQQRLTRAPLLGAGNHVQGVDRVEPGVDRGEVRRLLRTVDEGRRPLLARHHTHRVDLLHLVADRGGEGAEPDPGHQEVSGELLVDQLGGLRTQRRGEHPHGRRG